MMKKILCIKRNQLIKIFVALMIIFTMASGLAGCGSASGNSADSNASDSEADASGYDLTYSDRDLDSSYDEDDATRITLSGSDDVTIDKEGTYILSGTLTDGQVIVDTADDKKIQLVLDGVNITCNDSAAIYIKESDKVFMTLADGSTNTLTGPTAYDNDGSSDNIDGVIFSKADMTINGSGTLKVKASAAHGIVSKDDLIITGGTIEVTAVKDALQGKDCVKIKKGRLTLTAGDDAVKSNNDEDEAKGFVLISGGTFIINAGDDGVHADTGLIINGGKINIQSSYEGLEGNTVTINKGKVNVTASDDGINAAGGTDNSQAAGPGSASPGGSGDAGGGTGDSFGPAGGNSGGTGGGNTDGGGSNPSGDMSVDESAYIEITGGTIHVDASGDGIDSNGDLTISGGQITVEGPTGGGNGILDYGGSAQVSGGSMIMIGTSDMAQNFGDDSSQCSLMYCFTQTQAAGSEISLLDSDGREIESYIANKQFQCAVFSSPDMEKGKSYSISINGSTVETVTLSDIITSINISGGGQMQPDMR